MCTALRFLVFINLWHAEAQVLSPNWPWLPDSKPQVLKDALHDIGPGLGNKQWEMQHLARGSDGVTARPLLGHPGPRHTARDLSWPWEASARPPIARTFTAVTQWRQACWVSAATTLSAGSSAVCE